MSGDDAATRYPRCTARLRALLAERQGGQGGHRGPVDPLALRRVGPAVLRAPPALQRLTPRRDADSGHGDDEDGGDDGAGGERKDTAALMGDLVDMVLVGATDAKSGFPEVHLQFKSEVFGGLFLRLEKTDQGLRARFVVKDAATRRDVAAHVDDLVAHLRERGFAVKDVALEVA